MDTTASVDCPLPEAPQHNDTASEKKREFDGEDELPSKSVKKQKRNEEMETQRVAEIVMVLSAMTTMRGGRKPTEAEMELMAEAREKLAEICEGLKPKDLVDKEKVESVGEDLGFNLKAKERRLGSRGRPLSVKERFSLAKRKMEESKKFAFPSATHTTQPSFGALAENHVSSLPSTRLPASSTLNHSSSVATTVAPVTNQPSTTTVGSRLLSNHVGRDSFASAYPKIEHTNFKVEGGSNVAYASQSHVKVNPSATHSLVNAPSLSRQTPSVSESKGSYHTHAKVQGAANLGVPQVAPQAAGDQTFRPITQPMPSNFPSMHQPPQGMNFAHSSPFVNNHSEIAKLVQKILHPKRLEHPTWTPPSREYMNKALTCQMCKLTVNEVETVVLCDACEWGYHLKCLEAINQKGIPRAEWHCMKCLSMNNGKPFPPKYGRVMRSMAPPKGTSTISGPQTSAEKKAGSLETKVNLENVAENGSSNAHNSSSSRTGSIGNKCVDSTSSLKAPNQRDTLASGTTSSGKEADLGNSAGTLPTSSTQSLGGPCESTFVVTSSDGSKEQSEPSGSHVGKEKDKSVSESNLQHANSITNKNRMEDQSSNPSRDLHSQKTEVSNHAGDSLNTCEKNDLVQDSVNASETDTSKLDIKQNEQHVVHDSPNGNSGPNKGEKVKVPCNKLHNVEWIGDKLEVVDEKAYYESCCINGVTYKLQYHALCRSSNDKIMPLKLQHMWEDLKTGLKWVSGSWCYSPGDLPEAVGRPCAPESNEVYESNHESSIMAGLIQGPSEVLPPSKYAERNRLNQFGQPVFICKKKPARQKSWSIFISKDVSSYRLKFEDR